MLYKNTSLVTKTFYGVEFEPGEIKDVSGNINDPKMIRVNLTAKSIKTDNVAKGIKKSTPANKSTHRDTKPSEKDEVVDIK